MYCISSKPALRWGCRHSKNIFLNAQPSDSKLKKTPTCVHRLSVAVGRAWPQMALLFAAIVFCNASSAEAQQRPDGSLVSQQ